MKEGRQTPDTVRFIPYSSRKQKHCSARFEEFQHYIYRGVENTTHALVCFRCVLACGFGLAQSLREGEQITSLVTLSSEEELLERHIGKLVALLQSEVSSIEGPELVVLMMRSSSAPCRKSENEGLSTKHRASSQGMHTICTGMQISYL
jgi:hypothetical protein